MDASKTILDRAALSATFVEAIADQRVGEVSKQLLKENGLFADAKPMAEAAVAACAAISEQMAGVQAEAVTALAGAGVKAVALGDLAKNGELQFHSANIQISRSDLAAALTCLDRMGIVAPITMTPARVKFLSQTAQRLQLVRFDEVTTRIILVFDTGPRLKLPKPFRAGVVDVAQIKLPNAIWWAYAALKPVRILKERLLSRRSPHHEIDFLGTPVGLITPVLESLSLGPQDVLLDLGCGDGRVVQLAAEIFGCRAIGVEHNAELVARAKDNARASPASDLIEIRHEGAGMAALSEATVIFMFLPLTLLAELMPSIKARAKPGTKLVMHEQSRPGARFVFDDAIPVFAPDGMTVVRVQTARP